MVSDATPVLKLLVRPESKGLPEALLMLVPMERVTLRLGAHGTAGVKVITLFTPPTPEENVRVP